MFVLQTADANWNPSLLDESSRLFFKVRSSAAVVGKWPVFPTCIRFLPPAEWPFMAVHCPSLGAICVFRMFSQHTCLSGMDPITSCPPANGCCFCRGVDLDWIMQDCGVDLSAESEGTHFISIWSVFDATSLHWLTVSCVSVFFSWFNWTTCLHIGMSTQPSSPSTVQKKLWWVALHKPFCWKSLLSNTRLPGGKLRYLFFFFLSVAIFAEQHGRSDGSTCQPRLRWVWQETVLFRHSHFKVKKCRNCSSSFTWGLNQDDVFPSILDEQCRQNV